MLPVRIAPSLVKYAQLRYLSYQRLPVQPMATVSLSTCCIRQKPQLLGTVGGLDTWPMSRPSKYIICRWSTTNNSPENDSTPKFPSKEEIEKVFFKVTVTIWDFTVKIALWLWALIQKHIMENPTVQMYWKIFQDKLEKARKDI